MSTWLTLTLGAVVVRATRYVQHGAGVPEVTVDCSPLMLAPSSMQQAMLQSDAMNSRKFESHDDCSDYFIYHPEKDRFVSLYSRPVPGGYYEYECSPCPFDHSECQRQYCEPQNNGTLWDFLTWYVPSTCKNKLCNLASTGDWEKGGWWTRRKSKKKPWHATLPGPKSIGYQDAFNSKCWHGPKGFKDVLGDFHQFAERFDLITQPLKTFNKKACGCRTSDVCWDVEKTFDSTSNFCPCLSHENSLKSAVFLFQPVSARSQNDDFWRCDQRLEELASFLQPALFYRVSIVSKYNLRALLRELLLVISKVGGFNKAFGTV